MSDLREVTLDHVAKEISPTMLKAIGLALSALNAKLITMNQVPKRVKELLVYLLDWDPTVIPMVDIKSLYVFSSPGATAYP
jgi:hypothetical protein